jgi:threonine/homoserine/homoserine lactone efflux protein
MDFLAFLGVSLLVITTPGQDTALTVQNTLLGGRRAGLGTALGVSLGLAIWSVMASAGLAAVVIAWGPAFVAIKLAGAAYLVYLGVQLLRGAIRPAPEDGSITLTRVSPLMALRQGVLSNLGNPKIAAFFTSLLPQFVPTDNPSFWALLGLGLTFCALTLTWLAIYALVIARAGDVLRRPRMRRLLDGLMGGVMIGFGLRLATAEQ